MHHVIVLHYYEDLLCRKEDQQDHHNDGQQQHYCANDDCTSPFSPSIEIHILTPGPNKTIVTTRKEKKNCTCLLQHNPIHPISSGNNVSLVDMEYDGTMMTETHVSLLVSCVSASCSEGQGSGLEVSSSLSWDVRGACGPARKTCRRCFWPAGRFLVFLQVATHSMHAVTRQVLWTLRKVAQPWICVWAVK